MPRNAYIRDEMSYIARYFSGGRNREPAGERLPILNCVGGCAGAMRGECVVPRKTHDNDNIIQVPRLARQSTSAVKKCDI